MKLFLLFLASSLFLVRYPIPEPYHHQQEVLVPIDTVEFACLSHGGPVCTSDNRYYFKAYSANKYIPVPIQKQFNIHDGDSICIKKNGISLFEGPLPDELIMTKTDLSNTKLDTLCEQIKKPHQRYDQKK